MKTTSLNGRVTLGFVLGWLAFAGFGGNAFGAWVERVLYEFDPGPPVVRDGKLPWGEPIWVGAHLYGTTTGDSDHKYGGCVYRVSTNGVEKILHYFGSVPNDGGYPHCALLLVGTNLYGTAELRGKFKDNSDQGGIVFAVSIEGDSHYYKILHSFPDPSAKTFDGKPTTDGYDLETALAVSGSTLYGTTTRGGISNYGTVFKVNLDGTGYQVLHNFRGSPHDGTFPRMTLLVANNMLYGTTQSGGSRGYGTVFALPVTGAHKVEILHSFDTKISKDGLTPDYASPLVLYNDRLYGATTYGGLTTVYGSVYGVSVKGDGKWYKQLHSFNGPAQSSSGLVLLNDKLYGTTAKVDGSGTLYSIGIKAPYDHEVVYQFGFSPDDGAEAVSPPALRGDIYGVHGFGTTRRGGHRDFGTIYEVYSPSPFLPPGQQQPGH